MSYKVEYPECWVKILKKLDTIPMEILVFIMLDPYPGVFMLKIDPYPSVHTKDRSVFECSY